MIPELETETIMLDRTALPASLTRLYRHARDHDLAELTTLAGDRRHAVMIGAIAALPLGSDQMEAEWRNLLDDGCPPDFMGHVFGQMAVYLGLPRARQCLACLERVIDTPSRPSETTALPDDGERHRSGVAAYAALNADAFDTIEAAFGELAAGVVTHTFRLFGDLYAASPLALPVKQLATVAALGVLGNAAPQLRFHIGAALDVGVETREVVDTIAWIQILAGAPAAYNALVELKAALAAGSASVPGYR